MTKSQGSKNIGNKNLVDFIKNIQYGDLVRFRLLVNKGESETNYTGYAWGEPQIAFPLSRGILHDRDHYDVQGVDYVMANVPPQDVPSGFPINLIPIDLRNRSLGGLAVLSYEILPKST